MSAIAGNIVSLPGESKRTRANCSECGVAPAAYSPKRQTEWNTSPVSPTGTSKPLDESQLVCEPQSPVGRSLVCVDFFRRFLDLAFVFFDVCSVSHGSHVGGPVDSCVVAEVEIVIVFSQGA